MKVKKSQRTPYKRPHPTIGLFINETYGTFYQFSIISGACESAQQNDVNPVFVFGSELNTPRVNFRGANVLYRWVGAENVSGVIPTAPLFNYIDREQVKRFFIEQSKFFGEDWFGD